MLLLDTTPGKLREAERALAFVVGRIPETKALCTCSSGAKLVCYCSGVRVIPNRAGVPINRGAARLK